MAKISRTHAGRSLTHCTSCPLNGRPKVFGYGKVKRPDIALVAEAPGETEAEQGRPLVGKAGTFLRMVIRDLGISEDKCYFTNACLCRPEGNKKPTVTAIKACRARLIHELRDIEPKLIVTLGGPSTNALLGLKRGITKCHGEYKLLKFKSGFKVGAIPTYHPSGVLRGPEFFPDFVEELDFAKRVLEGEVPVIQPPYHNYEIIDTQQRFDTFLSELSNQRLVACDIETEGMDWANDRILCIGFSWEREKAYVIDWVKLLEDNLVNITSLDLALTDVHLSFHNGMYDVPFLLHYGLVNVNYYFDTMLAHYLTDERQGTHGLGRLAIKYYKAPAYKERFRELAGVRGFVSDEKWAEAMAKANRTQLFMYNGADTDYTFRLTEDLAKQVKEEGQIKILRDMEMPAARMFMEFHINGMLVDQVYWKKMAKGWRKRIGELEINLRKYPGAEKINFNSPKQLAKYLYDELELLPFGGKEAFKKKKCDEQDISRAIREINDPEAREYWTSKRTQMSEGLKGFGGEAKGLSPRSTATYMLYYLRQQHTFPSDLIELRRLNKRFSMYYKGIRKALWKDGCVHPKYKMTATRTGRKATEEPAMHNLPRGDEIYNIFIAPPGWVIIHADYKAAELRMMAHYAEDWHLLNILNTMDIHSVYAMEIFDLSQEQWDKLSKDEQKDKRIASKMITFGVAYGRSAAGLAPQLGVDKDEAQEYIETYFQRYAPRLKEWIKETQAQGLIDQVVIDVFGRRRRFPFIRDRYHRREVERQIGNFRIQSTINALTLMAQIKSIDRLRQAGIPAKPWAHIHDSLNIIVPKPLWKPAVQIINDTMTETPFETEVTFPAEIEIGERWGDMKVVMEAGEWVEEHEKEVDNVALEYAEQEV